MSAEGESKIVTTGKGASTDIIEASALAYLNAINRCMYEHRRMAEKGLPTL